MEKKRGREEERQEERRGECGMKEGVFFARILSSPFFASFFTILLDSVFFFFRFVSVVCTCVKNFFCISFFKAKTR